MFLKKKVYLILVDNYLYEQTSDNILLLLLDLGLLLGGEDSGQLLLLRRVMLHAAGAEPEVRQVSPDKVSEMMTMMIIVMTHLITPSTP